MKLLVQPADGIEPILKGIAKAKKSVEIMIFRFGCPEVRQALVEAVQRGVSVCALIAFTNRGGEKKLRELEADFLANGITVARTAGDLLRYHGKMMLVDHKELYILGFNLTRADIERSRSFGLVTRSPKLLREAAKLFEADSKRQSYRPEHNRFVVSPENARRVLSRFIEGAKRELLIYDPEISDRAMIQLLRQREKAGVKVRVLGKTRGERLPVRELKPMRLHARVMIRDREEAFVGSQSLRRDELDDRREIGVIFKHNAAIEALVDVFRKDWSASGSAKGDGAGVVPIAEAPKKIAKAVRKELPADAVATRVVKRIRRANGNGKIRPKEIEETVSKAVRSSVGDIVKETAKEVLKDAVPKTA